MDHFNYDEAAALVEIAVYVSEADESAAYPFKSFTDDALNYGLSTGSKLTQGVAKLRSLVEAILATARAGSGTMASITHFRVVMPTTSLNEKGKRAVGLAYAKDCETYQTTTGTSVDNAGGRPAVVKVKRQAAGIVLRTNPPDAIGTVVAELNKIITKQRVRQALAAAAFEETMEKRRIEKEEQCLGSGLILEERPADWKEEEGWKKDESSEDASDSEEGSGATTVREVAEHSGRLVARGRRGPLGSEGRRAFRGSLLETTLIVASGLIDILVAESLLDLKLLTREEEQRLALPSRDDLLDTPCGLEVLGLFDCHDVEATRALMEAYHAACGHSDVEQPPPPATPLDAVRVDVAGLLFHQCSILRQPGDAPDQAPVAVVCIEQAQRPMTLLDCLPPHFIGRDFSSPDASAGASVQTSPLPCFYFLDTWSGRNRCLAALPPSAPGIAGLTEHIASVIRAQPYRGRPPPTVHVLQLRQIIDIQQERMRSLEQA